MSFYIILKIDSNIKIMLPTSSLSIDFLPYQTAWIDASRHHRIMIAKKARRVGMTFADAAIAVLQSNDPVFGCNQVYIGADYKDYECLVDYFIKDNDLNVDGIEFLDMNAKIFDFSVFNYCVIFDEYAFTAKENQKLLQQLIKMPNIKQIRVISSLKKEVTDFDHLWNTKDIQPYSILANAYYQEIDFKKAVGLGLHKKVCSENKSCWSMGEQFAWMSDIYKQYGDSAKLELDCVRG